MSAKRLHLCSESAQITDPNSLSSRPLNASRPNASVEKSHARLNAGVSGAHVADVCSRATAAAAADRESRALYQPGNTEVLSSSSAPSLWA